MAAVSYGTNPLFAVPLYELGMDVSSVLFYRYVFAAMILGAIMWMRGDSFRLERRDLPLMVILGIFFALSSVLLFEAYNYMDVGLASTLLFVEPVFIALILWLFYREGFHCGPLSSIAICLAGVAFLCNRARGTCDGNRNHPRHILRALPMDSTWCSSTRAASAISPGRR
ncbi:DMT family transporter [Duncaniella dubosii]|nr:DMT family transporter [Duncaniella dubosii]